MFNRTKYTKKDFINAVKNNISVASVLKELGLKPTGSNYKFFYYRIEILGLDISHFLGQSHLKGQTHNFSPKKQLSEILVKNSTFLNTSHLRERLVKEGIIEYKCAVCGLLEWQNNKLSLHLDHINGINNDNRLKNLRLLCPNCHSQTSTYCRPKN
jgi:hypothetical protein